MSSLKVGISLVSQHQGVKLLQFFISVLMLETGYMVFLIGTD